MDEEDLGNKFIHITNPIVNKDKTMFTVCDDSEKFKGYKWSHNSLWNCLQEVQFKTLELVDPIAHL